MHAEPGHFPPRRSFSSTYVASNSFSLSRNALKTFMRELDPKLLSVIEWNLAYTLSGRVLWMRMATRSSFHQDVATSGTIGAYRHLLYTSEQRLKYSFSLLKWTAFCRDHWKHTVYGESLVAWEGISLLCCFQPCCLKQPNNETRP